MRKALDLHRGGDRCFAIVDAGNRLRLSIDDHQLDLLPAEKRSGLAALCLYQQPFGFSQEDVKLLEFVASFDPQDHPDVPRLRFLASRIASLLPPESKP